MSIFCWLYSFQDQFYIIYSIYSIFLLNKIHIILTITRTARCWLIFAHKKYQQFQNSRFLFFIFIERVGFIYYKIRLVQHGLFIGHLGLMASFKRGHMAVLRSTYLQNVSNKFTFYKFGQWLCSSSRFPCSHPLLASPFATSFTISHTKHK